MNNLWDHYLHLEGLGFIHHKLIGYYELCIDNVRIIAYYRMDSKMLEFRCYYNGKEQRGLSIDDFSFRHNYQRNMIKLVNELVNRTREDGIQESFDMKIDHSFFYNKEK